MTAPDLSAAVAILDAQPFSRLVAARLEDFGDGHAELRVPVSAAVLQQQGLVHGGVIAYAADNALTFAAGSVLGASVLTRGLTIEYLRPARGTELVARAHVDAVTRSTAVCRGTVVARDEDGQETVVALAQGTVVRLDPGRRTTG